MMATGKQNTGSYNIAVWLNENAQKMLLHDETIDRLDKVLYEAGYRLMANRPWSYY